MAIKGKIARMLTAKYERLLAVVGESPGGVAFSGGIDSTLVLKAAVENDPTGALALFADSWLQTESDRENVQQVAAMMGAELKVVQLDPLASPEFVANNPDRCYHCKKMAYAEFKRLLPSGMALLDGTNLDDLKEIRPGHRAIAELGVKTPLQKAGLGKSEVRELGRRLGLSTWNRPSGSCLATRIAGGNHITLARLRHIEKCERLVGRYCFGHLRARLEDASDDRINIELAMEELAKPGFSSVESSIRADLAGLGIKRVDFIGRNGVFLRDII